MIEASKAPTGRAYFWQEKALSARWQVLLFLLVSLAFVSRRTDAFTNPQFYAEDGVVWYAQAHTFGALHSFAIAQAGYLEILPRIGAALAQLVPLHLAPLVTNVFGLVIQVLPVLLLCSSRSSTWGSLPTRLLLCLAYVVIPNSGEINVNVTDTQWHFAVFASILAFSDLPSGWKSACADALVFIIFGVSGPYCILLLPFVCLYALLDRQRWTVIIAVILSIGSIIQILELTAHNRGAAVTVAQLGASPLLFIKLVAGHVFAASLIGSNYLAAHASSAALIAIFALGSIVSLCGFISGPLPFRLFSGYTLFMFGSSLRSPLVAGPDTKWNILAIWPNGRYWYFPMLMFLWGVIYCVVQKPSRPLRVRLPIRALGAALLLVLTIGIVRDWKYISFGDNHFQQYAQHFEQLSPGEALSIPTYPDIWIMHLIQEGGQCSELPSGSVDVPKPDLQLSGIIPVGGWASASKHIEFVEVYLDAEKKLVTPLNVFRPDVNAAYPNFPDPRKGWNVALDLSRIPPGTHRIVARAKVAGGCDAEFGSVTFTKVP